jgi:hypothetical protein
VIVVRVAPGGGALGGPKREKRVRLEPLNSGSKIPSRRSPLPRSMEMILLGKVVLLPFGIGKAKRRE